jgi:hypothetical protein
MEGQADTFHYTNCLCSIVWDAEIEKSYSVSEALKYCAARRKCGTMKFLRASQISFEYHP